MAKRSCSIDGCCNDVLVKSRGLCRAHYLRWQRTGSPTGSMRRSVEVRFLEKVDRTGDCWIWTSWRNGREYGQFWDGCQRVYAHRWAYENWNGPIPVGMQVCHRCDVPSCVNPAHLFVGSQMDNVRDCIRKGRSKPPPIAMPGHGAKVTPAIATEIRRRYERGGVTQARLAVEFGVSQPTINRVLK